MRHMQQGLTLIEILLALIVMVLGIVGILALFPPAIESSKVSMEETQGAILGESVANALVNASRFSTTTPPGPGGTPHYQLTITHDSFNTANSALVYYQFWLPNFGDGMGPGPTPNSGTQWYHHPALPTPGLGAVFPPGSSVEDPTWHIFRLTGDPWTKSQFDAIKGTSTTTGTDGSEPLNQFAYAWECRKINSLEYLIFPVPQTNPATGSVYTLAQLDPLVRVWEFRIHTYRTGSIGSVGSGTGGGGPGVPFKKWIATVTTRITVR